MSSFDGNIRFIRPIKNELASRRFDRCPRDESGHGSCGGGGLKSQIGTVNDKHNFIDSLKLPAIINRGIYSIMEQEITVGSFNEVMGPHEITGHNSDKLRAILADPANANKPLNYTSLLDARDIAKRLRELTGENFRVPSMEEMTELSKAGKFLLGKYRTLTRGQCEGMTFYSWDLHECPNEYLSHYSRYSQPFSVRCHDRAIRLAIIHNQDVLQPDPIDDLKPDPEFDKLLNLASQAKRQLYQAEISATCHRYSAWVVDYLRKNGIPDVYLYHQDYFNDSNSWPDTHSYVRVPGYYIDPYAIGGPKSSVSAFYGDGSVAVIPEAAEEAINFYSKGEALSFSETRERIEDIARLLTSASKK